MEQNPNTINTSRTPSTPNSPNGPYVINTTPRQYLYFESHSWTYYYLNLTNICQSGSNEFDILSIALQQYKITHGGRPFGYQ